MCFWRGGLRGSCRGYARSWETGLETEKPQPPAIQAGRSCRRRDKMMSATSFPPSSPPDALEALVARMTRGDQAALAELHDATSSRVFGTCMRILGEPAAAEEAALDAYLQAWRSASAFNAERGSVLAWLVMMARSRALDARRNMRHNDHAGRDWPHVAVPDP